MDEAYMSLKAIREALHTSRDTVWRHIRDQDILTYKRGRERYILRADYPRLQESVSGFEPAPYKSTEEYRKEVQS